MMSIPTTPTVDVPTAAEFLGVHAQTLYAAIRAGESPVTVVKIGRKQRVVTAALVRLLELDEAVE
jgi:excisionase family DNA binding protein